MCRKNFLYLRFNLLTTLIFFNIHSYMKKTYLTPAMDEAGMMVGRIICQSGNSGNTEDFGKGTGFSFDLFEGFKPF